MGIFFKGDILLNPTHVYEGEDYLLESGLRYNIDGFFTDFDLVGYRMKY